MKVLIIVFLFNIPFFNPLIFHLSKLSQFLFKGYNCGKEKWNKKVRGGHQNTGFATRGC